MSELGKIGTTNIDYIDFVDDQEGTIKRVLGLITEVKVDKADMDENGDISLRIDFGIGYKEWMDIWWDKDGDMQVLWNEYIFDIRDVRDCIINAINGDARISEIAYDECIRYIEENDYETERVQLP